MRAVTLASALALLALPAAATERLQNNANVNNNHSSARSTAVASAAAIAASTSRATGGNARSNATGGGGGAASASNGGNTWNDRLQAPGLASYAAPSGPCVGASTFATGSVAGFGLGGGRSEIEGECQVREAARLLHAMGATGEALALIRNLPSVRAGMPAPPPARTVTAEPLAAPVAQTVAAVERPASCMDRFGYNLTPAEAARAECRR